MLRGYPQCPGPLSGGGSPNSPHPPLHLQQALLIRLSWASLLLPPLQNLISANLGITPPQCPLPCY